LKAQNKDKKEENKENKENQENQENKNNEDQKEEPKEEQKEEQKEEEKNIPENNEQKEPEEQNNNEKKENDKINVILDSDRRIGENDVKNSPTLILEEKDCNIFNGEKITINASGMVGGREVGDGVSFFGSNLEGSEVALKTDFVLNLKEKFVYPYIFLIYYDKEAKSYFIRPYLNDNMTFRILYIKLTNGYNLPLKQKEIISAGNIIFQVSPLENNNLEIVNLSKQNLSATPKQTFDASSKKEVTIGRNKECDFSFNNNKSFSRIQTTFEFDEENQEWIIIDGSRTKSSTNGTWVFCTHSFPIKDKMIVEVLQNRFQISEEVKAESN
jgi:hypothetical protein